MKQASSLTWYQVMHLSWHVHCAVRSEYVDIPTHQKHSITSQWLLQARISDSAVVYLFGRILQKEVVYIRYEYMKGWIKLMYRTQGAKRAVARLVACGGCIMGAEYGYSVMSGVGVASQRGAAGGAARRIPSRRASSASPILRWVTHLRLMCAFIVLLPLLTPAQTF